MIYKNLEHSIIKFDGKVKKIYFKSNLNLKKKSALPSAYFGICGNGVTERIIFQISKQSSSV